MVVSAPCQGRGGAGADATEQGLDTREEFAHVLHTIIEIVKANSDRIEKMWEKVCIFLKLAFSPQAIQPMVCSVCSTLLILLTPRKFSVFRSSLVIL